MSLPIYKITIDDEYSDGEDLGIEQIAFTKTPAIMVKGMAFTSGEPKMQYFSDESKMRIAAPALIPSNIYRNGDSEYYVQFTIDEIEKIHNKFMSNLNNKGKFNLEHNQNSEVPAFILETWIVDNPKSDKSYSTFGIEVPKGTMFIIAQITDKNYYNELVSNDQTGFSIEGFLGLKLSEVVKKFEDANIHPNCRCEIIDGELVKNSDCCDYCRDFELKKIKEEKMENVLPEGAKFQIEDKWYEVKDGKVVEVIEAQKEVAAEAEKPEDEPVEDEKLADVKKEDMPAEVDKKELAEETVVTDTVDTNSGTYSKEEVDAKLTEIYSMIADLKSKVEASESEIEVENIPVEMSFKEVSIQKMNKLLYD